MKLSSSVRTRKPAECRSSTLAWFGRTSSFPRLKGELEILKPTQLLRVDNIITWPSDVGPSLALRSPIACFGARLFRVRGMLEGPL